MNNPKTIKTSDLRTALTALKPAIGRQAHAPAAAALQLEPGNIRANNYEATVEVTSPALDNLPTAVIDGNQLAAVLRVTSAPDVTIRRHRNGAVTISTGSFTTPLATITGDLPPWPQPPTRMPLHQLDPDEWAALPAIAIAAAQAATAPPVLEHVQLADHNGRLTAAATDRFTLAVADIAAGVVPGWKTLIPAPVITTWTPLLNKAPHPVEIWGPAPVTGEAAERTRAWIRVLDPLGEGSSIEQSWIVDTHLKFPDWQGFAYPATTNTATLNRRELLRALAPLARLAGPAQASATLTIDNGTLTVELTEHGAHSTITAHGTLTPTAVNIHYLNRILNTITGPTVTIANDAPHKPLLITGNDPAIRYVLMPVRLGDH